LWLSKRLSALLGLAKAETVPLWPPRRVSHPGRKLLVFSDDEVIPAREGAAVTSAADFSPSNGGDPNDTQ